MKLVLGTAVMMLLVGAPSYARQEPDKDKPKEEPKKQEEPKKGEQPDRGRQEQQKPADRPKQEPDRQQQDRSKPAQQDDRARQDDRAKQNDQSRQNDRAQQNDRTQQQNQPNRNEQSRPAQQQDRAQEQQRAQQTQHQTNEHGGGGRRIPDEQFRVSFGHEHSFHVRRSDDRRFNYGGYYFQYSDAWPSDWDYDRDDVYIDYVDGNYYLINPRHQGVRLLVVIAD
jgi:outer membrane biosynthesis protein TonB